MYFLHSIFLFPACVPSAKNERGCKGGDAVSLDDLKELASTSHAEVVNSCAFLCLRYNRRTKVGGHSVKVFISCCEKLVSRMASVDVAAATSLYTTVLSVFRASWLAKCASQFAFLSDCRSQRERQPALLPSRRADSKHEFYAHARSLPCLTHLFVVVSGALWEIERKKSRKLSRSDVALVVMPVTAARHTLMERYKAISL